MRGEGGKTGDHRPGSDAETPEIPTDPEARALRDGDPQEVDSDSYDVMIESGSVSGRKDPPEPNDLTEIADSGSVSRPPPVRARRATVGGRGPSKKRPDTRSGQVLGGRYRIERQLAKGGMGRVYLATQIPLERPVAVKVLNPDFQKTDPQFVRRFCLEASISARLSHPNVITIHDYGEAENGDLYMAMEFLDGHPLSRVIARHAPFPPERVAHIAIQICRGLREAHGRGVIHRDLKPGNVMIVTSGEDPDFVKVLDFGLVKLFQREGEMEGFGHLDPEGGADGAPELTRAGTLLGSPRYMSPEQIRGDDLDPRTDIYSLGIILYQMASGRAPFSGKTSVDVIYKHMNHEVPPLTGMDCPPPLESIIMNCLEKDRNKRFASMADLLLALKDAQRMITGNSVGTDSISIAGARQWTSLPKVETRPDTAMPEEVSSGGSNADDRAREAAFRENLHDEPTPTGSLKLPPQAKPNRIPMLLASLGFLIALVALIVVLKGRSDADAVPPPAVTPPVAAAKTPRAPTTAAVKFTSTPPGAEVREGDAVLGRTPFERTLKIAKTSRRFEFRLDRHSAIAVMGRVDGPDVVVHADLEAVPIIEPVPIAVPTSPGDDPEATSNTKPVKRPKKRRKKPDTDPEPADEEADDDPKKKRPAYYRDNPY